MDKKQMNDLAERFFTAVATGDGETIAACYTADATVWHNFDNETQTREHNLKAVRWLVRNIEEFRYTEVQRSFFEDGFVQRHVLRGRFKGQEIKAPTCMVVSVANGQISKIFEYVDSAHLAPVLGG